jgi:hypothetical protein
VSAQTYDTMTPDEAAHMVTEAKRLVQLVRSRLSVYRMHGVMTDNDPIGAMAAGRLDAMIDHALQALEPLNYHLTTHTKENAK